MSVLDSLPMALVLADLEDETGRPLTEPGLFDVLLAAAMLAELDLAGRLKHHDDARISIRGGRPDSLLEPAEHCLSSRPTPVVDLLDRIAAEDLRHTVCSHLVGMGALTVKTQRRWFRTVSSRWPTADPAIEEALRAHVRDHVAGASGPPGRTDTLVVLLDVAGLLGTIFGEDVPTERIDERTSDLPWRRHLRDWSERHRPTDLHGVH